MKKINLKSILKKTFKKNKTKKKIKKIKVIKKVKTKKIKDKAKTKKIIIKPKKSLKTVVKNDNLPGIIFVAQVPPVTDFITHKNLLFGFEHMINVMSGSYAGIHGSL